MSTHHPSPEQGHHHCHEHGKVEITVNKSVEIKPGKYTVAEVKAAAGVSPSFELEIIVGGRLSPLKDDACITIEGGERFSAQPRCGVAS